MRRGWPFALLLAGCLQPNGKDHHLYFGLEFPRVANGLAGDVLLPDSKRVGNFNADFTGTNLAASGPGLTLVSAEQLATGAWRMRVRCDADSSASTRELAVKVLKGNDVKYEDRYDLQCVPLHGVTFLGNRWLAVDAEQFTQVLFDSDAAPGSAVGGHGFAPAELDPFIALDEEQVFDQGMAFDVKGLKAGSNPNILAGAVTAPMDLTVLDDSQWSVRLTVSAEQVDGGTSVSADVRAVPTADADAGYVTTDSNCVFTVTSGASTLLADAGECTQSWMFDPGVSGQVCVSHFRHQACQAF